MQRATMSTAPLASRRWRGGRLREALAPYLAALRFWQTLAGPLRRLAHHVVLIVEQRPCRLRERYIAAITRRDQAVAHHPVPSDPLDRRAREDRAKGRIVEAKQIGELGRGEFGALSKERRAALDMLFGEAGEDLTIDPEGLDSIISLLAFERGEYPQTAAARDEVFAARSWAVERGLLR